MSRVRCRGSPTFDFQVDCTRIALDPRFKNMEGSIGARLIHVSEQKEARAPKTALWPASGAVYYNFPHAGAAWVRHLAALNKGGVAIRRSWAAAMLAEVDLQPGQGHVTGFYATCPCQIAEKISVCVCVSASLVCHASIRIRCFGDHLAILAPLASLQ